MTPRHSHRGISTPAARRRSGASAPSSRTAHKTARPARPWRRTPPARWRPIARPVRARSMVVSKVLPQESFPEWFRFRWSLARSSDRDPFHPQRRLADANRHALAVLAAGADAGIEREVVADHGDAM